MPKYQVRIAPIMVDADSPRDAARRAVLNILVLPSVTLSARPLSGSRETAFRVVDLLRPTPEAAP